MNLFLGIDNGSTGGMCLLSEDNLNEPIFIGPPPVKRELGYQKKVTYFNRLDWEVFDKFLAKYSFDGNLRVVVERPSTGFKITTSILSARFYEAMLISFERAGIPHTTIDSKQWQKKILPSGIKGSANLKKAGIEVAKKLYPKINFKEAGLKDADALLIAHWARMYKI